MIRNMGRTDRLIRAVVAAPVLVVAAFLTGVTSVVGRGMSRGQSSLLTALASGAARREALTGVPLRCWDAR